MACTNYFYTAPFRHLLGTMACLGMTLAYSMRQVLPIMIIEMAIPPIQLAEDPCRIPDSISAPVLRKELSKKLDWTELQQAFILMGFYIGYSFSHFVSGPIITKFGARWPIAIGMTISTVATGMIPIISSYHWTTVLAARILTGASQSVLMPGISSLLTSWIPLETRSMLAAIIFAGVPLGTFLGIYMSAIIAVYYANWHYGFYLWTLHTIPWIVFFLIYIYSYPESHPAIDKQGSSYFKPDFIKRDEIHELGHAELVGHVFSSFGHTYILFTMTTYLPKYLNVILKYEMEDNLVYSGTPFIFMYFSGIVSRMVFRWCVDKKNFNAILLRLIYCAMCTVFSGCTMLTAFYFACSHYSLILGFFHLSAFLSGFFYGGLNFLDMSMRHSGFITSIINGLSCTSGIFAIGVIAFVVKENSVHEWQTVACILVAVTSFSWVIELICTCIRLRALSKIEKGAKRWYHQTDPQEHRLKMEAAAAIREELKIKQRGGAEGAKK